jgi:pentatricopeptide repeat protein
MGLRHWFRERMLGNDPGGDDVPPGSAIMNTLLGREGERHRSLGEYDSSSYPADLREQLARRAEVAQELLRIDIASPPERVSAIPELRTLLRKYPHPLVYETLIHACLDAGRFDEAKGVVFAARQRRLECIGSEHPEIRAEVASLREWDVQEIDELREAYSERA